MHLGKSISWNPPQNTDSQPGTHVVENSWLDHLSFQRFIIVVEHVALSHARDRRFQRKNVHFFGNRIRYENTKAQGLFVEDVKEYWCKN